MSISQETFVKEVSVDLQVISVYKDLMEASTGKGSAYIKAKETLVDLFKASTFTESEKASIIAQTISTIATSITSDAMATATQIAKENRDAPYLLAKVREETILAQETSNKVVKETAVASAQAAKILKDTNVAERTTVDLEATGVSKRTNIAIQTDLVTKQGATELEKASLVTRQTKGFDDDAKQKLLKQSLDSWSVAYSVAKDAIAVPDAIKVDSVDSIMKNAMTGLNIDISSNPLGIS